MSDLPSGWARATTGELFTFVTSGSRGWAKYYTDHGAPFIRIGNLRRESIALNLADIQRVNPPAGAEGVRTRVASNDILISITADLGRVALVTDANEDCYINQHIALARPVRSIYARYLAWYLSSESVQRQWGKKQRGVTKLGLGLDDIRSVDVPIPPAAEQHRIVAAIEEQFSRLDTGVVAIERARRNLERLRAAMLDGPFRDIPSDQWEPLASLGKIVTGGTPSTSDPNNYGDTLPFVTPSDFSHGDRIASAKRSLSLAGAKTARYLPAGSVLVTCIGATLGKVALATESCASNQQINAVIPKGNLLSEYLFCCLSRPSFVRQMWQESSSTTLPILNKSRFSALKVPVTSLSDQRRIVEKLSEQMIYIDRLSVDITKIHARVSRTRLAILSAAFSGKLVQQNPRDEPVSVLLERIAAQRAASNGTLARKPRPDRRKVKS
jgi:type I restriction enzyme, S subunit